MRAPGTTGTQGVTADQRRTRDALGQRAAEAADRGARLRDVSCRITVDLSELAALNRFRTESELTFRYDGAAPVWLDLVADRVTSVWHNGTELDLEAVCGPERVLLPQPDRQNTVRVTSVHRAGAAAAGLCRTVDAADGAVYAWTQFQPFDARRVFACFDQPDVRARTTISVIAPHDWTCLSNTSPAARRQVPGGAARTDFAETPPLPSYLVAVCAGPFASRYADHGGVRLGVHARASLAQDLSGSAPELFDITRYGLDRFTEAFGVGYPLDCYDQVFLPDQPGAMENLGCVTWNDQSIYRATPSAAQRARRALVLLHELSHQWFGDLVTPRWWDDLWLSESFADWAAVWAIREYPGLAGHPGTDPSAHLGVAMRADQMPSTHPVSRPVPDMQAVTANFDAITYAKGAALLRDLVDLVSEQGFLAGLRGYFRRHAWSNATIDDLLGELDRVCAVDVTAWADQWLRTDGVNTISVGREGGSAVLRQTAPAGHPLLRRHRVSIGRFRESNGRLVPDGSVAVTIDGPEQPIDGIGDPGVVLLPGDGRAGYAKFRTDPSSLRSLLTFGHTLSATRARAGVRIMLADMLFDAEISGPDAVAALVRFLTGEGDDGAAADTVELALSAARSFTAPPRSGPVGAQVAGACLRLARGAEPGGSRWHTAWQGLAGSAWTDEQVGALLGLLRLPDLAQSLRWQVVTRLVALGRADVEDVAAQRRQDNDPDADRSALVAAAAAGSVEDKRRGLDALLSPTAVPIGALAGLAAALWQPHQHELLAPIVVEFLDALPGAIRAGGPARAMRLARWCLPEYELDPPAVDRIRALAGDVTLPDVATTALADQAALAERRARTAHLSR